MPHVALTQEELDRLHPSLVPPCDEQLDDLVSDERDGVYQKGLRLAEEIRNETSLQGRMRRPLLAVTEQQQHDDSSSQSRTRTIRPFGGGVISGATTYVPLLTQYVLPLPGTTTTTTTTTTGAVAAVSGGRGGNGGREESRDALSLIEQIQACALASFCGSNQPSEIYSRLEVLAP
jgi:hypothetical protein